MGSLLGDAVSALESEEREEKFHFQMVDLGVSTAHFRFATRMAMARVKGEPVTPCIDVYEARIQSDGNLDEFKLIIAVRGVL